MRNMSIPVTLLRPSLSLAWVWSVALFSALLSALSLGWAQPTWTETGTVTAVIDGAELRTHTYAASVPEDVAEGVTDEQQRAILEKVAGTDQHTATFMVMDPIMAGPVEIVPATLYVTIMTSDRDSDDPTVGTMEFKFSLSPEALEPGTEEDVEVLYYPRGSSFDDYYAMTDGTFELAAIEVVDDTILAVSGSFSGVLSWQDDLEVAHNPEDTLTIEGTFEVDYVVASDDANELIRGE